MGLTVRAELPEATADLQRTHWSSSQNYVSRAFKPLPHCSSALFLLQPYKAEKCKQTFIVLIFFFQYSSSFFLITTCNRSIQLLLREQCECIGYRYRELAKSTQKITKHCSTPTSASSYPTQSQGPQGSLIPDPAKTLPLGTSVFALFPLSFPLIPVPLRP